MKDLTPLGQRGRCRDLPAQPRALGSGRRDPNRGRVDIEMGVDDRRGEVGEVSRRSRCRAREHDAEGCQGELVTGT